MHLFEKAEISGRVDALVHLLMRCERTAFGIKERRHSDSPGPWKAVGMRSVSRQRAFILESKMVTPDFPDETVFEELGKNKPFTQ